MRLQACPSYFAARGSKRVELDRRSECAGKAGLRRGNYLSRSADDELLRPTRHRNIEMRMIHNRWIKDHSRVGLQTFQK